MEQQPRSIFGIPVIVSDLIPPGEVWTFGPPTEPGFPPQVVRLTRVSDDEPEEVYPPCRCGREIRKLNAASDDAKCVGCGYTEELCRCQPTTP